MAKRKIAYLVSNNSIQPDRPFVDKGKGFDKTNRNTTIVSQIVVETYFAPPFGDYDVVYVNTFEDMLKDLNKRAGSKENETFDQIAIFAHGTDFKNDKNLTTGHGIHLRLESHSPEEDMGREAFEKVPAWAKKTGIDLAAISERFTSSTTISFFGCELGLDPPALDSFRKIFGGQELVIAPLRDQRFQLERTKRSFAGVKADRLLPASADEPALLKRLAEVSKKVSDPEVVKQLKSGFIPRISFAFDRTVDEVKDRTYPAEHDLSDYAISRPPGSPNDLDEFRNRLNSGMPGWNQSTAPKPTEPASPPVPKPTPNEAPPVIAPPVIPQPAGQPDQPQQEHLSIIGRVWKAFRDGLAEGSVHASEMPVQDQPVTGLPSRPLRSISSVGILTNAFPSASANATQQQSKSFLAQSQEQFENMRKRSQAMSKAAQDQLKEFESRNNQLTSNSHSPTGIQTGIIKPIITPTPQPSGSSRPGNPQNFDVHKVRGPLGGGVSRPSINTGSYSWPGSRGSLGGVDRVVGMYVGGRSNTQPASNREAPGFPRPIPGMGGLAWEHDRAHGG